MPFASRPPICQDYSHATPTTLERGRSGAGKEMKRTNGLGADRRRLVRELTVPSRGPHRCRLPSLTLSHLLINPLHGQQYHADKRDRRPSHSTVHIPAQPSSRNRRCKRAPIPPDPVPDRSTPPQRKEHPRSPMHTTHTSPCTHPTVSPSTWLAASSHPSPPPLAFPAHRAATRADRDRAMASLGA